MGPSGVWFCCSLAMLTKGTPWFNLPECQRSHLSEASERKNPTLQLLRGFGGRNNRRSGCCWAWEGSAGQPLSSFPHPGLQACTGHTSGKEWCGGAHWDPTLCLLSTVGYPKGKCFMGWWRHSSGLPVQGNLGRRCVWDEFGKLGFQQGFTEPPVGGELCESPGVLSETGR